MSTPMMEQYERIKRQYPDAIVFFRLGDFYEMFGDDAVLASRLLDITLTSREAGKAGRIPMCGVPYHSADSYVAALVSQGYKVAVCDQLEDPRYAKGLVERDVVRVVTPGTIVSPGSLEERANNFLVAITRGRGGYGLAVADVSTGEFQVTQFTGDDAQGQLLNELQRLSPAECLLGPGIASDEAFMGQLRLHVRTAWPYDDRAFHPDTAYRRLTEHFGVHSLAGYGCEGMTLAIAAAGAILQYLSETQKTAAQQITGITTYSTADHMVLDGATRRSLELVRTLRDGSFKGSLLWVLDKTETAMGGRMLRRWLDQPLLDRRAIEARLDAVEDLVRHSDLRRELRSILRSVADIERLIGRVAYRSANARDLVALRHSLERVPRIKELILSRPVRDSLRELAGGMDELAHISGRIAATLVDDPPASVKEGGLIRDGFHEEVDRLRAATSRGKEWIAQLEEAERARTGIKSLKVGFNKVFGYYIEVTRPNLHLVPPDYERKQTLAGAERFITPALKEQEALVLGAEERVVELEYEIFSELRDFVASQAAAIQATARRLAALDALASLAQVAVDNNWCRPEVADDDVIEIRAGRHPVVEAMHRETGFVPNDTRLDRHQQQLIVLTGPNMAGKSTYLRQVALITLLAHIGSFVPAESAHIGLVDRIFTRVGAADDLGTGQSTFMVEMNEAANILHHATAKSLIVIDELGRGTSTYDGLALTHAIAAYIHDRIGARTLISTHYHELTRLPEELPRARNYRAEVAESRGRITFLYKIVPGGADRSYGINVARMAGIPKEIIRHAQRLLKQLEAGQARPAQLSLSALFAAADGAAETAASDEAEELSLHLVEDEILNHLRRLDIPRLTPLEALNLLAEWQAKLVGRDD
ncbi:MAG: DNA mismatch repair protein MutS [Bacillota bacterium]|nr:MAG: DNA mismatch repair protein MutS [Bacillota bacterium]